MSAPELVERCPTCGAPFVEVLEPPEPARVPLARALELAPPWRADVRCARGHEHVATEAIRYADGRTAFRFADR